jgi:hypothetical protein
MFMKKAECWLKQEEEIVQEYLPKTTPQRLLVTCGENLLTTDRNEDLGRMLSVVSRSPDGLNEIEEPTGEPNCKSGPGRNGEVAPGSVPRANNIRLQDP